MANITKVTDSMRKINMHDVLEEPEQLVFSPHPDSGIAETIMDNVPRYLFRVATPQSDGMTNDLWVRSDAALKDRTASMKDIFYNLNTKKRAEVANILNLHLRWEKKGNLLDNFISWTSSLLFAIEYIYYRHHTDDTPLEEIKFFVVDTTMFPRGTFMRDLDLIIIFYGSNKRLRGFRSLRNGGTFYFGEYLSQGLLKIENKCQLISADVIFERDRLRRIQPLFASIRSETSEWANAVIRLRRDIWPGPALITITSTEMRDRLQAIEEIMPHISARWQFPVVVYFAALIGAKISISDQGRADDNVFFAHFHSGAFSYLQGQHEFRPSNSKIIAPDTTPELKQVEKLAREIYKYSFYRRALERLQRAESIIRTLHTGSLSLENGHGSVTAEPNPVLARAGQAALLKVRQVEIMCHEVAMALAFEDD